MEVNQPIKELLNREYLHDKETHALISLLASEQAAVQTYDLAIRKIRDKELIPILENCRDSHDLRIRILKRRLQLHGDNIPDTAGWLGTVAGIVENGATIFGDRVSMSLLAAGEELELEQCQELMKDLDNDTYNIVEGGFLPAQKRTLETMTILCAWLKQEAYSPEQAKLNPDSTLADGSPSGTSLHARAAYAAAAREARNAARRRTLKNRKKYYNPWYFG